MSEEKSGYAAGYGKRPLWQWIALYVVVAAVLYGLFYYFVIAKNGYSAPTGGYTAPATNGAPAQGSPAY